jgi:hypothetical protein
LSSTFRCSLACEVHGFTWAFATPGCHQCERRVPHQSSCGGHRVPYSTRKHTSCAIFLGFPTSWWPYVFFSQSFMPSDQRVGFPLPSQGGPAATIDLTAGSQKRSSQECVTDPSKSNMKRRAPRKKHEIC